MSRWSGWNSSTRSRTCFARSNELEEISQCRSGLVPGRTQEHGGRGISSTGGWRKLLGNLDVEAERPVYVGRPEAASPATGLASASTTRNSRRWYTEALTNLTYND